MSPVQSWPSAIGIFIGLSAVAMSLIVQPARADEAYLCGPDNIMYVSVEDLPELKRTNACIAAYYGLTVDPSVAAQPPSKSSGATAQRNAKAAAGKPAPVMFKPMAAPEARSRARETFGRQAALAPPSAAPGTDYRNVKILNAASDATAIYRHDK